MLTCTLAIVPCQHCPQAQLLRAPRLGNMVRTSDTEGRIAVLASVVILAPDRSRLWRVSEALEPSDSGVQDGGCPVKDGQPVVADGNGESEPLFAIVEQPFDLVAVPVVVGVGGG